MRYGSGRRLVLSVGAVILCMSLVVWLVSLIGDARIEKVPISSVIADVEAGRVESIEVEQDNSEILVRYPDGYEVRSRLPGGGRDVAMTLQDAGLNVASPDFPEVSIGARASWGETLTFVSVLVLGMLLPIGVIALGVALGIRLARR